MTVLPLVVSWFLTLGYVPEMQDQISSSDTIIYQTASETMYQATTTKIGLSFETQDARFKVYTDIQSFQYAKSPVRFSPFRIDFSIGAQLNITDPSDAMTLHLNIDHECVHPVSSHNKLEYNYAGGITVLSLTVKGSSR